MVDIVGVCKVKEETDLSIHSLVSVLHRLQDIAVKLSVCVGADADAATARHQDL